MADADPAGGAVPSPSEALVDPAAALARLDAGNARFVSGALEHPRRDHAHRAALSSGQRPYAAVLGCSDSRVPHEILFDEGLGDLFAVRVAGNTAADAIVLGSIEFAVAVLGVRAVVVLGHEDCGAVKAALDVARGGDRPEGALTAVVDPIVPVAVDVLASMPADASDAAVLDARMDGSVHVIVIRGAGGKAFSAGGDVAEFLTLAPAELEQWGDTLTSAERCRKPVIAAIDGYVMGAGLELALACDFRIATRRSELAFPEIRLGMPGKNSATSVRERPTASKLSPPR